MSPESDQALESHLTALLRRRIKFVVEKGAMARLFKWGTNQALQSMLSDALQPEVIASPRSRNEYDDWLNGLVTSSRWEPFSRNGLSQDRWAYFAKLINIIIYEITSNRELFSEHNWERLRPWLHVPLDSYVLANATSKGVPLAIRKKLIGMTNLEYMNIQTALRDYAAMKGMVPIWFEDAWTGPAR
jgi:hypothetical protein